MSQRLSSEGARLVPRSHHDRLDRAFRDGIAIWETIAHRDHDDFDLFKVEDPALGPGLIVVDETDGAELHLVLEPEPTNGAQVAIAIHMEW